MALLVECPECKSRNSLKKTKCSCGFSIKKAPHKVYWVDYLLNGIRKRERIGPSKLAAENRLRAIKTKLVEEKHIDKDKNTTQTLGSIINWYLGLSSTKVQSSFRRTRVALDNIKRIIGKELKISQLSLETMEVYLKTRSQERSRKYPDRLITVATTNREISALKRTLNEGVKYGLLSSNPIKNLTQQPERNTRERVLSDEEFERLLAVAPEYMKPILLTAFYEPMRFDEILKLEWDEIDLKTGPGFIRLRADRTKGKKEGRAIPLHPRVKEVLQNLPSRFIGGRVFLKNNKPVYDIRKNFKKALNEAGIEDFLFHDFRHCAVTNLRKAGNDIATIMKISGHKTTAMFYRYNLVDDEDISGIAWKKPEGKKSEKQSG